MNDHDHEMHACPSCGQRTPHVVHRDRKLAPVLWCKHCYNVRVEPAPIPAERHAHPCSKAA